MSAQQQIMPHKKYSFLVYLTNKGISMKPKATVEIDSSALMHIMLTETDTLCLLDIPSVWVSGDQIDEATEVKAQNAKYKELKSLHQNNDNFVCRATQTYIEPQKSKDVQATAQSFADAEINTTQWGIYDAYEESKSSAKTEDRMFQVKDTEMEINVSLGSSKMHDTKSDVNGSNSLASVAQSDEESSRSNIAISTNGDASIANGERIGSTARTFHQSTSKSTTEEDRRNLLSQLNQSHLQNSLDLMERAVVTNNYEKKIISYRNVHDCEEMETKRVRDIIREHADQNLDENNNDNEDKGFFLILILDSKNEKESLNPNSFSLVPLWGYRCELTRGRQVMYTSWNKQNEDLIAVAYGEARYNSKASPGLILLWSIKNPEVFLNNFSGLKNILRAIQVPQH
jgi:hypothetical protein